MKTTALLASIAIITLSSTANARDNNNYKFVATDNSIGTNICIQAAKGKKFKFVQLLRHHNVKKRYVVNKLKCNEIGLPKFVAKYNANADKILNLLPLDRAHVTIRDIAHVDWKTEK